MRWEPDGADGTDDIYGRLLRERIIFMGTQVDDASANLVCAQEAKDYGFIDAVVQTTTRVSEPAPA